MNIKEAKIEIANTLRAYHRKDDQGHSLFPLLRQRPILLMSPPGIGKTAIMEQIAQEEGVGLVAYTMTHHTRQSAVGLPRIQQRSYEGLGEVSVTEYTLSEIIASVYDCMERTGKREGILFIDEINCVSETLAPTMLQFLQSKTFGSHRVPPGWMIVAAGNPPGYNKSVRSFDVVTLDRLRQLNITADCGVWLEYAREHGVHGSILSYLGIREDHFYHIECKGEDLSFVTARGWEDLSELIHHYEALALPVTEELVGEYLQNEAVARSFAAYYQLYRKYDGDYAIPAILSGALSDTAPQVAMARAAAFEERFTVTNLVLDCLNRSFDGYRALDQAVVRLHEALKDLRSFLRGKPGVETMDEFLAGRRRALAVKRDNQLLSPAQEGAEEDLLRQLEGYRLELSKAHITDAQVGFNTICTLFQQELAQREALVSQLSAQLDRAFAFLEQCFGDGPEMLLFLTSLTRMDPAMDFIGRHGCPAYIHWSSQLLTHQQEEALLRECQKTLSAI